MENFKNLTEKEIDTVKTKIGAIYTNERLVCTTCSQYSNNLCIYHNLNVFIYCNKHDSYCLLKTGDNMFTVLLYIIMRISKASQEFINRCVSVKVTNRYMLFSNKLQDSIIQKKDIGMNIPYLRNEKGEILFSPNDTISKCLNDIRIYNRYDTKIEINKVIKTLGNFIHTFIIESIKRGKEFGMDIKEPHINLNCRVLQYYDLYYEIVKSSRRKTVSKYLNKCFK